MILLLSWGNTPVNPNPNPCQHVYLGWDSFNIVFEVLAIGTNMIFIVLFGPFLPYEKGRHKGDLMGYYSSSPYITPCNLFGI